MNLTRQDRQVITNFSKFSNNLEFKKNLTQTTTNRNAFCEYTLQCDEFKPFLIYDTPEFLSVLSCYNNPKIEIFDDKIILKEFNQRFKYYTAERNICVLPKKSIAEIIEDKIPITSFELSFDDMKNIQRVNSLFKLPHLIFKSDEDNYHSLIITDVKNSTSLQYCLTTDFKTNRKYNSKVSGFNELQILISNYKVSIFEGMFLMESKDIPLKYLIALDPTPTPDSKKESKSNA
jgi:hypothetical protein|tara:strand:- start:865 stop:1563 length:699 start_codon:yes stop_codon:yes gene_type:complete